MGNSCLVISTIFDIFAILSPLIDLAFDIITFIRYYTEGYTIGYFCSLVFIIIATLVNTIVYSCMSDKRQHDEFNLKESTIYRCLRWPFAIIKSRFYAVSSDDDQNDDTQIIQQKCAWSWFFRWLCDILFWLGLSTLIYPLHALKCRIGVWRANDINKIKDYEKKINSFKSDGALLNLLEFALESAPQFVLKCCFLIKIIDHFNAKRIESAKSYPTQYDINYNNDTPEVLYSVEDEIELPGVFDYVTTLSSAVFMGLSLALYQRAVRLAQDKNEISRSGTICLCIGHFLLSLSQGLSLSLVAYLFPWWTVFACVVHAGFSVLYIHGYQRLKLDFCNEIGAFMFSLVLGIGYIFTFVQVVDKPIRIPITVYYLIKFAETVICCGVWCLYANEVIRSKLAFILILIALSFVLGLIILRLYYACLHPTNKNRGKSYPTERIPLNEQLHLTDQQSDLFKPKVPKVGDADHQ